MTKAGGYETKKRRDMQSTAQQFADMHQKFNAAKAKFNMDKHNAEVQEQRVGVDNFGVPVNEDVKGFPTVIMYKKDGTRSLYKGPREVASMLETMNAYYR